MRRKKIEEEEGRINECEIKTRKKERLKKVRGSSIKSSFVTFLAEEESTQIQKKR